MRCAWAVVLLVIAAGFFTAAYFRVDSIGGRENRAKAQETIGSIATKATLDVLRSETEADEAVQRAAEEEIPKVSGEARDDVQTQTEEVVQEASSAIPQDAADTLQPAIVQIEELSESQAELAAQAFVNAALDNLTVEPDDLANAAQFQSKATVAAQLGFDEALQAEEIQALPETDIQALEQFSQEIKETTANALTAAIDQGIGDAAMETIEELQEDTKKELGEEDVSLGQVSIPDTAVPAILLALGAATFQQFLSVLSQAVTRRRR